MPFKLNVKTPMLTSGRARSDRRGAGRAPGAAVVARAQLPLAPPTRALPVVSGSLGGEGHHRASPTLGALGAVVTSIAEAAARVAVAATRRRGARSAPRAARSRCAASCRVRPPGTSARRAREAGQEPSQDAQAQAEAQALAEAETCVAAVRPIRRRRG